MILDFSPKFFLNLTLKPSHFCRVSFYPCPKRKAPAKNSGKEDHGDENNPTGTKKAKLVWLASLHNHFLQAIRRIGLEKAIPKSILQFINVPGITREKEESHLQVWFSYKEI
ncbi:hypothetical protein I3842_01G095200 [Carya illinoinensis]|uniref:Uncharacterized protein n=1 Tax=Carya illinoinensis TaxID=32201 RepID=A0A922K3L0_CARIL|nr:hypothetical protein I3842_01G095200 [Carya illinoinensis]